MKTLAMKSPVVKLNNGLTMPQLGLGVLKAKEGGEVEKAVSYAIENGYTMIDTAAVYGNEAGVGRAIAQSKIPRENLFLVSKVWNSDQGYEKTLAAFELSLERLGTDYLDLYLIHWPVKGLYKDTWRALETLYKAGKVKAIGVSNFQKHHLEDLMMAAEIAPMVNQIEMHPLMQQKALLQYANDHQIQIEAWRPIMMGQVQLIPTLRTIAQRHEKSPAQIALRWLVQQGVVVIPKSVNPTRIDENADVFDFVLSEEEMAMIAQLDQNKRLGPDPDNFNF